jgi:NAD(P)-dependent dehydrogenase (short-subunit alcohol dehydrogenase family)
MYDLDGKVALITGAARYPSTGRALALRLAEEGADVVINGRYRSPNALTEEERQRNWRGVESVKEEVESLGKRALGIYADVTEPGEVRRMFEDIENHFGHLDILVNNAAVIPQAEMLDTRIESWNECLAVNLTGPFLCSTEAARHMIRRGTGGKIVNINSRAGKVALPGLGAYSAAKFGLTGLTQVMSLEWAQHKINVNGIFLGAISDSGNARRTAEIENPQERESKIQKTAQMYDQRLKAIPLERISTQEDLGNLVCFLVSEKSDFITGETVDLSGGHSFTNK